jgi:hypothetical protein
VVCIENIEEAIYNLERDGEFDKISWHFAKKWEQSTDIQSSTFLWLFPKSPVQASQLVMGKVRPNMLYFFQIYIDIMFGSFSEPASHRISHHR